MTIKEFIEEIDKLRDRLEAMKYFMKAHADETAPAERAVEVQTKPVVHPWDESPRWKYGGSEAMIFTGRKGDIDCWLKPDYSGYDWSIDGISYVTVKLLSKPDCGPREAAAKALALAYIAAHPKESRAEAVQDDSKLPADSEKSVTPLDVQGLSYSQRSNDPGAGKHAISGYCYQCDCAPCIVPYPEDIAKDNRAEAVQDASHRPDESEKSVTPTPVPKYPHADECEWLGDHAELDISMFMRETDRVEIAYCSARGMYLWHHIDSTLISAELIATRLASRKRLAERAAKKLSDTPSPGKIGEWFYSFDPECTQPHSVMEKTISGCTAICHSPWTHKRAAADMKRIAADHNEHAKLRQKIAELESRLNECSAALCDESARIQIIADLERELAEAKASLDTAIEVGNSYRDSLHNLGRYCEDATQWALPMSGHAIIARDLIKHLRGSHDNAIMEERRLRAENQEKFTKIVEIEQQLADAKATIERLQAFKTYVHRRLDEAGVSIDPESPHKAAGCRIGGRLDEVLTTIERLTNGNDNLLRGLDATQYVYDQLCTVIGVSGSSREVEAAVKSMKEQLCEAKVIIDRLQAVDPLIDVEMCEVCGLPSMDWAADDSLWNLVAGDKNHLCPRCFAKMCAAAKLDEVAIYVTRCPEAMLQRALTAEAEIARLKTPLAVCEAFCELVKAHPNMWIVIHATCTPAQLAAALTPAAFAAG